MPYRVEISPNKRAGCKGKECKGAVKIEKGMLRFGSWVPFEDRGSFHWRHWGCVTVKQVENIQTEIGIEELDFDLLDGFEELPDDEKDRIRRAVDQGHIDDEDVIGDPALNRPGAVEAAKAAEKKAKQAEKAALKDAEKARKDSEKDAQKQAKQADKVAAKKKAKRAVDEDEDEGQEYEANTKKKRKVKNEDEDESAAIPAKAKQSKSSAAKKVDETAEKASAKKAKATVSKPAVKPKRDVDATPPTKRGKKIKEEDALVEAKPKPKKAKAKDSAPADEDTTGRRRSSRKAKA